MGIAIPQVITSDRATGASIIDGSLKFDGGKSTHLTRTPSIAGNRKTWTWSSWIKRTKFGANGRILRINPSGESGIQFASDDKLELYHYADSSYTFQLKTTQVFRDTAWYHIVIAFDTTQSTSTDRVKFYVNGTQVTSFSTSSYPSQNFQSYFNLESEHAIFGSDLFPSGYVSQVNWIDGQALTADSFGFTDVQTNTWKPKKYIGSFTSTTSEAATLNTSFATSPPTDSTGTTTLTTQNISTQTASTNSYGVTTSTAFDGGNSYSRVTTNLSIDKSEPFTIDFIAKFVQSGSSSYFCQYGSGSAIIQTDNPAANTTCLLWGAHTFSLSYGWHSIRVQWDGSRSKLWVDGTLTLNITNAPGGSDGNLAIGAHPTQDIRTFNGEFGPFRFTPTALGAPKSGGLVASDFTDTTALDNPNSFYLPMDGNSPISEDKSRKGNTWTPVNFGGSLELDNPNVSGARPILNTTQGGTQAGVGVFGSKENVVYTVTVASVDGGNRYHFDGVDRPTLSNLIRGVTYTFDQSDSSNGSHPLVFGSTAEGNNFRRGALYGSISPGNIGAATTITIPYDAPETLYYHCSSHSGMGGSIVGIHTDETKADQYASNCVLSLPLVGSTGDVSASIACTSTTKVMSSGNATASSTQSNHYGGSFNLSGTSSYINTPAGSDFAYGTEDFTIEAWIWSTSGSGNNTIYTQVVSGTNYLVIVYNGSGDTVSFLTSGGNFTTTNSLARERWNHVAVVRKSGTASIYLNGKEDASASNTYNFSNTSYNPTVGTYTHSTNTENLNGYIQDFRIYKGAAKYDGDFVVPSRSPDILPDTPSGVSGSSKLAKITDGAVSFDGTGDYLEVADNADFEMGTDDFTIEAFFYNQENAVQSMVTKYGDTVSTRSFWLGTLSSTNPSFYWYNGSYSYNIDGAAGTLPLNKWSHVVAQRTSGDIYLFVDGKVVASNTGANAAKSLNDTSEPVVIGSDSYASNEQPFQGFISNVRIVKGTGVYNTIGFTPPTAPLTNVTNTKLLCCQSNTSATTAAVTPGSITANGDAAATNFNPFNTDINTVRGQETGYCTLNPLQTQNYSGGSPVIANGNLEIDTTGTGWSSAAGIIAVSSNKWYWEYTCSNLTGSELIRNGIFKQGGVLDGTGGDQFTSPDVYNYASNAQKWTGSGFTSYGATYTAGDTIGVALDLDAGTLTFYKNGSSQGSAYTGLSGTFSPYFSQSSDPKSIINFGQKPFKFPPPDGFQPLNTANIRPETVITRPDQYVGISTWTGNSTDNRSIPVGFQPDLVWTKRRDTALDHFMWDSVRGAASELYPNQAYEAGTASPLRFGGFYYDGFIVNNHSSVNQTGNWVAWTWKAGGNKNTFNKNDEGFASAAAAGLTAGTITPVGSSVGTKQGFSIIQYQGNGTAGAQVPHGLTQTPDFTIIKSIDDVSDKNWFVGGNWAPGYGRLLLNSGVADNGSPGNVVANDLWNNTAPTSSVVTLGSYNGVNDSGDDYIMYNWHNIPGLQKFGTYTGKSALNFVELGFRPALVILKNQSNSSYTSYTFFAMFDSTRDTSNTMQNVIFAGKDQEENKRGNGSSMSSVADFSLDFLSNGFALRDNGASEINLNTNTYVYAAWAETPTVDLFGGGANAR